MLRLVVMESRDKSRPSTEGIISVVVSVPNIMYFTVIKHEYGTDVVRNYLHTSIPCENNND